MHPYKSVFIKVLFLTLKITLALLLVWWLWQSGKLNWRVISEARANWALAGVVLFQVVMIGTLCWRWHLLLKSASLPLHWHRTILITLRSQCTATFLPGSIGIDGTRLYYVYKIFPEQRSAASISIIWDRLTGIGALIFLTFICNGILLFFPLPPALKSTFMVMLLCCAGLLIVPFTLLFPHNPLRRLRHWKFLRRIPWQNSTKHTFALPSAIACFTHFCNAMAMFFAFYALGYSVPLGLALLLMPAIILTSFLPLTPLGLGVTDAVALLLFSTFDIANGANVIMVTRIVFVVISALCGLAWFVPIDQNK